MCYIFHEKERSNLFVSFIIKKIKQWAKVCLNYDKFQKFLLTMSFFNINLFILIGG